ncbi:DUF1318 domain-containing protein [Geobacter sp. DSM 9736]|uniref:DUF1318 domain-containing protein n=1 Tax=Geobacter sp. DSM 9736 TaxID=1277350 RepID=UPI000B500377|nr:DUF1318 domain-containing protein [Geobacter sp. DSM 9736]SNB47293.1 Protein of unknown function [Geobacter sp. DSM 9736]
MNVRMIVKWLLMWACGSLAACAIITVNVYFPEKDVKQAYKSLDEMLLKQGDSQEGAQPGTGSGNGAEGENKPQSWLLYKGVSLFLVTEAHAEEPVADQLAIEISSMPEVLKAYDEMKERLSLMDRLRESGAVGETKQGLVSVRDKGKLGGNQAAVEAENSNRKTIITAMAKAILKLNKQPQDSAALNQVLGKAAASYASTKQEEAKTGWWIELQNGRWVQKQ